MTPLLLVALCGFLPAFPAPGSQGDARSWQVTDAPSLLRWAAAHSDPGADYREGAVRYLIYARAGARAEARAALKDMEAASPGDPDAERYGLRLDASQPLHPERLQAACDAFLARWQDSPAVPAAQYADMVRLRAFVAGEAAHAKRVRRARRRASLLPLGILLLWSGLSWAAFRRLRPGE